MENPKIIELINADGVPACVTTTYGSVIDLASLVLSSMLSNPRFAEVIMISSAEYTREKTPKEAMLN